MATWDLTQWLRRCVASMPRAVCYAMQSQSAELLQAADVVYATYVGVTLMTPACGLHSYQTGSKTTRTKTEQNSTAVVQGPMEPLGNVGRYHEKNGRVQASRRRHWKRTASFSDRGWAGIQGAPIKKQSPRKKIISRTVADFFHQIYSVCSKFRFVWATVSALTCLVCPVLLSYVILQCMSCFLRTNKWRWRILDLV